MSIIKEFKDFAMRGNVVDMAVGIIIGSAIGKIVTSLVNDLIMPPIGLLLGGVDFTSFAVTLKAAAGDTPAVAIHYGTFINVIVDFLIVVLVLFMVIKLMNTLRPKKEPVPLPPEKPSREELLLTEIRDLLKKS
jgi:large conductance mechanosensitive channel